MAFKLSELVVEIKGDDSPVQKVVNSLKSALPGAASKLGSTFSSAFTVALGPIGYVMKAVEGLFNLIDEGNEDVAKLGEYFTEAIGPIKAIVEGVVGSLNDWITKLIETAKASEFVQNAIKIGTEYIEAGFENVRIAIDQGITVFNQMYAVAQEVFTGATILVTELYESLMKAFGNEVVASATSVGETIKTWIVDKLELAGVFIRNWPTFWEIAVLQVKTFITNIGEYMQTIPANAAIIGEYIANNWVKLFHDGINAVIAGFKNLGSYLGELGTAIVAFFKNPAGGFKAPEWKGLLEGFKATADKFPEMIKPSLTTAEAELAALYDKIGQQEAKGFEKHKPKAKEEAKTATAEAEKQKEKFQSQSFGSADFYTKLRQSIFSDKDDTPKATLKATERIAKASEETAEAVKKPKAAVLS